MTMAVPSRKERIRPVELLSLSGGMALFSGLIVLMATRDLILTFIVLALVFIVVLVVLAMLTLAAGPTGDEKLDLDEQNSTH
jgi:hypothetical protein